MQYFILLPGDTQADVMNESNILGEESLGKFIYGDGFKVLNNIVNNYPEHVDKIKIIDEQNHLHEISDFLDMVAKLKVYK